MPLTNGQIFAGYTIIRLLGSGAMGEVYLAQHPRLPRKDALKVLSADVSADADYRARFNREADLASTLWHPHIVGVHDRGEEDGQLWISMDFVDGLDAARLLADRYPAGMPIEEVARIVTAVASALDYAHKQGLLHRDVKPANIMMTHLDDKGEQRILLTDFGIARNVNDISGLTKTNMTVGTVAYCSPEQLLGEDIDGRADQYALAATAYHLLTGSQLFPNSNPAVVISRHLNVSPPALADGRPALAKLDPVLAIGLAKRPEDRFERCSDFAHALSEQIDPAGAPTTSAPTASAPRAMPGGDAAARPSRRRTVSVAVFVAIILVASIGAVVFLLKPSQHDGAANSTTSTGAPAVPAITFDGMRSFVEGYYADLPADPTAAWAKVDARWQNHTGQRDFLDFWATIQSVTLVSVSPRDATSVVARVRYVPRTGKSSTEDRWLKIALVNGVMMLDESGRIGTVNESTTTSPLAISTTVVPDGLEGLLLNPDQISDVMAAAGMRATTTYTTMKGLNGQVSNKACLPLADPVDAAVYAGSGWYAMRGQGLDEPGWNHLVYQNVVLFPSAHDADTFFTASAQSWPACANRQFTVTQTGKPDQVWTVGPVSDTGHMLHATKTQVLGEGWTCHRGLTVANNVAIDVQACSKPQSEVSPLTAYTIAQQIVVKVPKA